MKLFARFFNDTSYTHHKTIFNQSIIFSRQMFFQTVFIILGGFIIEQECPLDSLTDLLCYESYCIPSGRLPRYARNDIKRVKIILVW